MLWLRKRVVPHMIQVLLLILTVAVATDGLAVQNAFLNVEPTVSLGLYNGDSGDNEYRSWKMPKCPSVIEVAPILSPLFGRISPDMSTNLLILSPPGFFPQPDRGPPYPIQ